MERDFKGIWIPKEIWLSTDLTLQEKVFLVEISSLDNEQGCFAGNSYFSEFFGVSKTRVSIIINSLVKKGYITSKIIYKEGSKQILKRVLKECYIGYTRKVKDPMQEKFIENNILNNTSNKGVAADAVVPKVQYIKRYKEFVTKVIPGVNIQVLDSQIMRLKKHIDDNLLEELEKSSYLKGLKDKKPGVWVFTVVKNINDIKLGVYRDKEVSQEEKNTPSRRVL